MSPCTSVARGVPVLRHLLDHRTCDLRGLDLDGFRSWLEHHRARWQRDPAFVQRSRIRDLRRAHPELRQLETEHRRAAAADAGSPQFERLEQLQQGVIDSGKAIAGLSSALADALPEKQPSLQQKLDAFRLREAALRQEQAELLRSSEARQALNRVAAELERLRASIGLDREEARLAELQRERGRRSGRSGASFEEIALDLSRRCILPDLLRDEQDAKEAERVRVLRGVTLGAARTEIDQLVVRAPPDPAEPVEVLALVEVKRNLNDLAHGFLRRQENLAWLTGDRGRYDSAEYRTRQFPSGHFDRGAVHRQGGDSFFFAPASFRRFRSDAGTGMILDGLYLLTRRGSIWGVSGATLARIGHRIATDERWEPDDAAYLRRLLDWCRSLAGAIEAPEVLRLYLSTEARARQILVVRSRKNGSREADAGRREPEGEPTPDV